MLKISLITLAALFAVMAAGLVWGWEVWIFDDRAWRQHSTAWGWLSLACFAASCHPLAYWIDKHLDGRASQP